MHVSSDLFFISDISSKFRTYKGAD
jgi:hypothetical protein